MFFNKNEKGALPNLLYKANIILMPKPGEITITKKTMSLSLTNIEQKSSIKYCRLNTSLYKKDYLPQSSLL